MNTQLIEMKVLSETEAWSLFKDKAGACADDSNLQSIAQKVAKECNGLPLALVTVGSLLKDQRDKRTWKRALHQLKSPNPEHRTHLSDEVYKPLRLSYDFLQDEDAKSVFLLCSLFPDDYKISLNDLALYSMGLKIFEGLHGLEQVREAIFTIIMELKSRFLLMDCDDENEVKMHDVVRDVAIFIGKEKGLLGAEHGQFDKNCTWISVFTNSTNQLCDHCSDFNFPNLQLLAIQEEDKELEIGDDISLLERMPELKVLSLRQSSYKFGKSIKLPKKLRTLQLKGCDMKHLSFDALPNLEILSCEDCLIRELPMEIGRLKCLKLLNLSDCDFIQKIAPGVIQSLIELEELKMLGSFFEWESSKVKEEERRNVALKELEALKKLKCLEIGIWNKKLAEEDISLPPQIEKYKIVIGEISNIQLWKIRTKSNKFICVYGFPENTDFANWIHTLVSTTDGELHLDGEGSRNFDLSQVYNKIDTLNIASCSIPSVMHLVRTQNPDASFGNLRRIQIEKCHRLRNLSWLRRTNDGILLPQLEEVKVLDCEMMEQLVFLDETNNGDVTTIIFSKLVRLVLHKLPSLTTLIGGAEAIEFPSLEKLDIDYCPMLLKPIEDGGHNCDDGCLHLFCMEKVHFRRLKDLSLNGLVVNNIWCPRTSSSFFQTLERLVIKFCTGLSSLFEPSTVKNLVNLKELHIEQCYEMEQVVAVDNEIEMSGIMFPNLKVLTLMKVIRLKSLGIAGLECPMLIELNIDGCRELRETHYSEGSECAGCTYSHSHDGEAFHLFYHEVKIDGLRVIRITDIDIRSNFLCKQIPQHFFRELMQLSIWGCKNIKNVFSTSMVEKLVHLESLCIDGCREMKQVVIADDCIAGNKHHITLFPKLRILGLISLPILTCFGKGVERVEFPMVELLIIVSCRKLIGMVASNGKSKNNICNDEEGVEKQKQKQKADEERVEKQKQACDDENSNALFNHKVKFVALEKITLRDCDKLGSICSCATVENLLNLKELDIESCSQLEEVIAYGGNVRESSMRFPRINRMLFTSLPSLRMFCSWSGALELPSLEKMSITECPRWEGLAPGSSISAPRLTKMKTKTEEIEGLTPGSSSISTPRLTKMKMKTEETEEIN